jgi:peptide/nickel transport system permease protein
MKRSGSVQNKTILATGACIGLLALAALAAPFISPYDPLQVNLAHIKEPPGAAHWMGTDRLGRDVLSRVIYGARFSLGISIIATLVSLGLGMLAGLVAGYARGRLESIAAMVIDLFLAFPSLLLAVGISVLMPPGQVSTIIALCLVGWAPFARLFQGMVLSLRESAFVEAGRAIGCSAPRILFYHLLPHCLPVAIVAASLKIGGFMLSESALSFLGLGVQPPLPTWGNMISLSRSYLPYAPWMVLFPGLAIAVTVTLFNILGDAVRDAVDPKLKF